LLLHDDRVEALQESALLAKSELTPDYALSRGSLLAVRTAKVLGAAVTLVAAAFAFNLHLKLGLYLFAEQGLAFILALSLAIIFLTVPVKRTQTGTREVPWFDRIFAILGFAAGTYLAVRYPVLAQQFFYRPTETFAVSIVIVPLTIEALRRTSGWSLVCVLLLFMLYALFGDFVPGTLQGRPIQFTKMIPYLGIDKTAMFGMSMYICSIVVVMYILMGQLLIRSGGSEWFTHVAAALMGRRRGGSAKIAIFASALFGSISGNAVSNVVSTGVVTIPLMKQAGYEPKAAAAYEAVASTGGQITPPVMGAAGFLMAEFLQIPYTNVMLAAIVPAFLYYIAAFAHADLEAARKHIAPLSEDQIPPLGQVLKHGWFFPLPFLVLVITLFFLNRTPEESALWASGAIVVLSVTFGYKGRRIGFRDLIASVTSTGQTSVDIVIIGAMAGMVIGLIDVSGLGFGVTFLLVQIGEGNLIGLMLLTAFICIIVGMGMPTAALYILVATLVAPPLVRVGVDPLAAHLFVFYFGLMSMITPPVALAAFAAANLAGSNPVETALAAMRMAWPAFVVPFMFALSPNLIMKGEMLNVALAVCTAAAGIWLATAGFLGYFLRPIGRGTRAGFMLAGLAMLVPAQAFPGALHLNLAGLALSAVMVGREALSNRRAKSVDTA
jgi:TRAP transporter 4TM/12TM fusion protein